MARYDLDQFFVDLDAFLKANLNTYVAAINTEKGDEPVLTTIDSAGFFVHSLNGPVVICNPYVLCGLVEAETDAVHGHTAERLTVHVMLCITDVGDTLIWRRLLRYQQAIKDLFHRKWNSFNPALKLKLKSLAPASFRDVDTSELTRVIGVSLEVTLA